MAGYLFRIFWISRLLDARRMRMLGKQCAEKSCLVIPPLSCGCAAGLLFPAVDLGLRGPKAAYCPLPALPRGLPALAQGQQPTTAAARDPFRNSPLEFIHPTSQSGLPAV